MPQSTREAISPATLIAALATLLFVISGFLLGVVWDVITKHADEIDELQEQDAADKYELERLRIAIEELRALHPRAEPPNAE